MRSGGAAGASESPSLPPALLMKISSTAFENGEAIPALYSCDGGDINPPLAFSDIPADAKTLALIVDDPDAPSGLFVHWVVWNIPPTVTGIAEGSVPEGVVEGMTDFGKQKYGGPCPGRGEHRYFFKIYALDTELLLPPTGGKEELEEAMVGHVLQSAELMGQYMRK